MPHAIGDSMYMMVLVRNLICAGHPMVLVGGVIHPLRDWFPYAHFVPDPPTADVARDLGRFPRLIQMFPRKIGGQRAPRHNLLSLIGLPAFKQKVHILQSMLAIAVTQFGLNEHALLRDNGIQPPAHLVRRRYANRVVIHPTASNTFKTWDAKGFVTLAQRLQQRGLEPWFVVPPAEASAWRSRLGAAARLKLDNGTDSTPGSMPGSTPSSLAGSPPGSPPGSTPNSPPDPARSAAGAIGMAAFDQLTDLASFIYESGWFIGNDSGIGHLSSALGIPTLSLFPRKGLARRWRPGWGDSAVILPLPLLLTTALKERFWRPLLPVSRVLNAFDKLQARGHGATPGKSVQSAR